MRGLHRPTQIRSQFWANWQFQLRTGRLTDEAGIIMRMDTATGALTLTPRFFRQWQMVVTEEADIVRILATGMPDPQALDDVRWVYGRDTDIDLVSPELFEDALLQAESERDDTAAGLIAALDVAPVREQEDVAGEGDLLAQAQEAPVVRLVNLLLLEALEAHASDVHIEATRSRVLVRYRVDGVLLDAPSPPAALTPAVIGRLKVMSEMDVAERRRPQDGRIRLLLDGRSVERAPAACRAGTACSRATARCGRCWPHRRHMRGLGLNAVGTGDDRVAGKLGVVSAQPPCAPCGPTGAGTLQAAWLATQ